ncbi:MAG: VOC family protein [Micromonosporaceae bacterium]|nr:VOC family protein [Micromonosporaceae bacterium]
MLRGLTTTVYQADDLTAAAKWYGELLGIEPYFVRLPYYVEFRIGDYQHELGIMSTQAAAMLRAEGQAEAAATGGAGPAPGSVISYWHVDDIEAAYQRLLSHGATAYQPPRQFGPGFTGASVLDPFGNLLGVMQNQHYLDVLARIPAFELPEVEPVTINDQG